MLATIMYGPGDVRVEERPKPALVTSGDAIVRVVASCVCGSDLWGYRGVGSSDEPKEMGHEFIGVVESIGETVASVSVGDFVISPFTSSDGSCPACLNNMQAVCDHLSFFGADDTNGVHLAGGQGEYVRVPFADGTLVPVPGPVDDALIPSLLSLSDVMSTGHHGAVCAGVGPETSVVVVGDGAVGLSAVLAARRLGATRIIAMSRNPARQAVAREFGATDIVEARGREAGAVIRELLGGVLADCVVEAVGTKESMEQALASVRPGGRLGYVGVPAGGPEFPIQFLFSKNIAVSGGMAPARAYIPELLVDVLSGAINPGLVFDLELPLSEAAEGYRAMDERRAIKALLRP